MCPYGSLQEFVQGALFPKNNHLKQTYRFCGMKLTRRRKNAVFGMFFRNENHILV